MSNYIKISRSLLDWGWYHDAKTCRLFLHMLLRANWKEGMFRGSTVPRGSFISSIRKLADETNMTVDEVRTALEHLLKTGEVTKQSTSGFSLFSVENYDRYQAEAQTNPKQSPSQAQTIPKPSPNDSQTNPKRIPTIEEGKKGIIEKEKGNTKVLPQKKKIFRPPETAEVQAYCAERGNQIDAEAFVDFYESKGWMVGKTKMKDWKAAVRNWERNDQTRLEETAKLDHTRQTRLERTAKLDRISEVDSW